MCFSASASFISALLISVGGFASLLKARTNALRIFATIPIFFALQQALEGIVWLTLMQGDSTSSVHRIGVYGFLFFAGVFWPVCVSGSLYLIEKNKKRKKMLLILFIIGMIAAARILFRLLVHSHTALIINHHISYPMFVLTYKVAPMQQIFYSQTLDIVLTLAYLLAVIVPLFLSTLRGVWVIGVITTLGFIVAVTSYPLAFGSTWCFFGALATLCSYFIVVGNQQKQT